MNLIITDHGDPMVGIFPQKWSVDCPLNKLDEMEVLVFFKKEILKVYQEFSEGKLTADYDFEIEQENEFLNSIEK